MNKTSLKPFARAKIKDIRKRDCKLDTSKMLVDTNVLYFCYYDRWTQLNSINKGAKDYQLKEYTKFFKRLLDSKISLFVHKISLCEFAQTIEMAELQILYCEKNKLTDIDKNNFVLKEVRRAYAKEDVVIKTNLSTYLNAIGRKFTLLNLDRKIDLFLFDFLLNWKDSIAGTGDAIMISEAKEAGINCILSDDSDLISFKDIELYTANNLAINCH
jgi:predicted nucleic acid-binding protein